MIEHYVNMKSVSGSEADAWAGTLTSRVDGLHLVSDVSISRTMQLSEELTIAQNDTCRTMLPCKRDILQVVRQ